MVERTTINKENAWERDRNGCNIFAVGEWDDESPGDESSNNGWSRRGIPKSTSKWYDGGSVQLYTNRSRIVR